MPSLDFEKPNSLYDFEFDKNQLYLRFLQLYPDFKANHFTQKRFTGFLHKYADLALGCKEPVERRSNGVFYIKFTKSN